ncbi:hypothetical protein MIR68_001680 [Amoeboaphelidium protococcarum]|nr:hypothetical protein MIR68_001680 [Amoeboaphelidium protococcarum]
MSSQAQDQVQSVQQVQQNASIAQQIINVRQQKKQDKSSDDKLNPELQRSLNMVEKRWNEWSVAVRQSFVKRVQAHVLSSVQTRIPKKQWNQWEVTLRFCLDHFFDCARAASQYSTFNGDAGHESESIGHLLKMIVMGKEQDFKKEEFDQRINEMLSDQEVKQVPNFDPADNKHKETLLQIRSMYMVEWAAYFVQKMVEN